MVLHCPKKIKTIRGELCCSQDFLRTVRVHAWLVLFVSGTKQVFFITKACELLLLKLPFFFFFYLLSILFFFLFFFLVSYVLEARGNLH